MEALCYRIDYTSTEGDSPAALGNRIAAAVIAAGRTTARTSDGATPTRLPAGERAAGRGRAGRRMTTRTAGSRSRWTSSSPRTGCRSREASSASSARSGATCAAFALPRSADGLPDRPGAAPRLGETRRSPAFKQAAVDVIRDSSELDPATARRSTSARARRRQPARHQRRRRARRQPGRPGKPYAPNESRAATSPACWPSSGPTARARRRRPATGTRSPTRSPTRRDFERGSAARADGRPARVGRQALLRAQRRGPRRGHRGLGREAGTTTRPARSR